MKGKATFVAGILAAMIMMLSGACNETNRSGSSSTAKRPAAVFMGNSITDEWVKMDESFFTNPNFIAKGISGQTTGQMLDRFETDVVGLKPAVVVILGGINDIAENEGPVSIETIFHNIVAMSELAKANNIEVVLCSVLPAGKIPWRSSVKPIEKIIALNQLIKSYCTNNALPYVDFYKAMVDEEKGLDQHYTKDGVHPNLVGYKIMEPLVANAVKKV